MFAIIQAAGWLIWPLLFASVIAVALMIERAMVLRPAKIVPPDLLRRVVAEYQQGGANETLLSRLQSHSPLGRILSAGMRNAGHSREVMKEAIEEAGQAVSHDLGRYLTTLGTIASIAPLMGLFGTMVGMIEIFGASSTAGNNPQALAHGISIALYNTAFGLVIAIPTMIAYRHFRALVDSLLIQMAQEAVKLVDIMHGDRS